MAAKKKNKCVADEVELQVFFTGVVRGEPAADEKPPGVKDQLKAAELLGKCFGMFSRKEKDSVSEPVEFVGDAFLED